MDSLLVELLEDELGGLLLPVDVEPLSESVLDLDEVGTGDDADEELIALLDSVVEELLDVGTVDDEDDVELTALLQSVVEELLDVGTVDDEDNVELTALLVSFADVL